MTLELLKFLIYPELKEYLPLLSEETIFSKLEKEISNSFNKIETGTKPFQILFSIILSLLCLETSLI